MRWDPRVPDWHFVTTADQLVGRLQTRYGFSLPGLRRESVLALWAALALACVVEINLLGWESRAPIYLGYGAATFWPLLLRLRSATRDARTDWSPSLARRYLADSRNARVATGRFLWCLMAGLHLCVLVGLAATGGLGANGFAAMPLSLAVLAYHYLACATPRTPGRDGRRSASTAMA